MDSMTTISNQNGSFAPEPFRLPLSQPQSTTVSTLQEALNSTTRLGTIATCRLYNTFSRMVLCIHDDSWAGHRTEGAFCNAILQDLDAMLYYHDTDWQVNGKPVSLPGNLMDMATILAGITLLLIGADACTPHIIDRVWGADETVRLALGGPRGDLSLIRRRILTHQKVAINTVHIWLTNPLTPVLPKTSESFKLLPRTLQQLLLDCSHK